MIECTLFGTCGGCSHQNLKYEDQLALKRGWVEQALKDFQEKDFFQVKETIGSPKPYGYRHMIALSVNRRQENLHLGFVGHDRRTFLPIESCPITDNRINEFLPDALRKLEELVPERRFHTSQVVLRVGSSGEVVSSIRSDRGKLLSCSMLGKSFTFSMSSFFQNNFSILESFIKAIRQYLNPQGKGTLFDLYSGVGLIGIQLADSYQSVIGLEEGYEAVKYAQENARQNQIENIDFQQGKVEALLPKLMEASSHPLHVVVDPPRTGLKPEVIDCLNRLPIERLIYISCHLDALTRDLAMLTQNFRIKELQPLDFFPQTKHIETIALLVPRK